jgi:hypothetical protein
MIAGGMEWQIALGRVNDAILITMDGDIGILPFAFVRSVRIATEGRIVSMTIRLDITPRCPQVPRELTFKFAQYDPIKLARFLGKYASTV